MAYPVAIFKQTKAIYPASAPFHPQVCLPEAPFPYISEHPNTVYQSLRELFCLLKYDLANYGNGNWNPLGWLINPGETVFIKPNMITHKHTHSDDWDYVITHGSVIRAMVDYVYIALQGRGRIIIGDGPQTDSHFAKILELMGLREIVALYQQQQGCEIEIADLRNEHWIEQDGIYTDTVKLAGDPRGSINIDLAGDSMFTSLDGQGKKYYGAFYDTTETNVHHCDGKHEYAISRSPLTADVFINIPKLKTHKKCGLTVNLKSLVGINANKNWLPHYIFGSPATGGDQFEQEKAKNILENTAIVYAKQLLLKKNPLMQFISRKTKQLAYQVFGSNEDVVRSGNWYGNDTVWRMCLDLNRILLYLTAEGVARQTSKRYFSLVDGIMAMEGNGPVAGTRREAGLLIAGSNAVAVDAVCAKLMGFNYQQLPLIAQAFAAHKYPLIDGSYDDIEPCSNLAEWNKPLSEWSFKDLLHFRPHFAWQGKIELTPPANFEVA